MHAIRRSARSGSGIGNASFPSLLIQLRFSGLFIPPMRWIAEHVVGQNHQDQRVIPERKVVFLALRNVVDKWELVQFWKAALSRFTILGQDRILTTQQR